MGGQLQWIKGSMGKGSEREASWSIRATQKISGLSPNGPGGAGRGQVCWGLWVGESVRFYSVDEKECHGRILAEAFRRPHSHLKMCLLCDKNSLVKRTIGWEISSGATPGADDLFHDTSLKLVRGLAKPVLRLLLKTFFIP